MSTAALLAAALAWPAVLAALWLLPPVRQHIRPLLATMALPALLLVVATDAPVHLEVRGLFTGMGLGVDGVGRSFLLLTALLWSVVVAHAVIYSRTDPRRDRFLGFLLVTGTANIGLTLAVDILTFYLFFALMTFAAFGLIVHTRTAEALRAGRIYIIMAVLGEALLLAGMFTIIGHADGPAYQQVPHAFAAMQKPGACALLLLLGFGVKAGLMPLHSWLPLAHPVAPTPASALLSGAMIKAGVLGWIRFLPIGELPLALAGTAAVLFGTAATLIAALIGLTQSNAKTVLAYSSVSQMGFMSVGIGAALLLPEAAPLLVLAVTTYAIHHAVAKAGLFLGVGLVPSAGRYARAWLVVAAVPAVVLAGAPLTSGALAKAALGSAVGVPPAWWGYVDTLLSVAAVTTTLLMARYLFIVPLHASADGPPHPGLLAAWLTLVVASAGAVLWLPLLLRPLGELPAIVDRYYVTGALWPLLLGAATVVAVVIVRRGGRAMRPREVPAGDIVIGLERIVSISARAVTRLDRSMPRERWSAIGPAVARRTWHAFDSATAAVERALDGPALGVILCVLAVIFVLVLR